MTDLNTELATRTWDKRDTTALESHKSVIQYGLESLKSSAVINGAGAAALLAFVSANSAKLSTQIDLVVWSMGAFVVGMLVSALACGASYFSQMAFSISLQSYEPIWQHPYVKESERDWARAAGRFFQVAAIVLVIGAYVAFVLGVLNFLDLVRELLVRSTPDRPLDM